MANRTERYEDKEVRRVSFQSWPTDHPQKKENLADAGFYYSGRGDAARCFSCGIGLRGWKPEDNVWVEHARWSPECQFVRQIKGQDFVDAQASFSPFLVQ